MNVMTCKNIRFRFNHTVALQTLNLSKQRGKHKSELFFNKKSIKKNKLLLKKFPPLVFYIGILLKNILYCTLLNRNNSQGACFVWRVIKKRFLHNFKIK